jgi:protein-tyrosine phosphatase
MIDLHSHILYGIDDGAEDMQMSLDMARRAVDHGTEVMACTPHFLPGVYEPDPAEVVKRVGLLNQKLIEEDIDLVVVSGCEAHVRPDMATRLKKGDLLTIHTGRYVLCEAPPSVLPPNMDRFFMNLMSDGYMPILAHVERYRWAHRDPAWVERVASSGVLLQVTAGSFFGDYGHDAEDFAKRLLGRGMVHIVASDAHDVVRRPPGLAKARDYVASEMGEEAARQVFTENPEAILLGHTAAVERPEKVVAQ